MGHVAQPKFESREVGTGKKGKKVDAEALSAQQQLAYLTKMRHIGFPVHHTREPVYLLCRMWKVETLQLHSAQVNEGRVVTSR